MEVGSRIWRDARRRSVCAFRGDEAIGPVGCVIVENGRGEPKQLMLATRCDFEDDA